MYTYGQLLEDCDYLRFKGVATGSIGKSESGFDIPYVFLGEEKSEKRIIISGGIHARENVGSSLVIRQAFFLLKSVKALDAAIYFVPMINVDGALLIEKGADFFSNKKSFLIDVNDGKNDFSMWKANINAVDLNTNFDANFGKGISNKFSPSPSDYVGQKPFDQSETFALMEFTKKILPKITVSYHALGQEIYWYFGQTENYTKDELIADKVSKQLKYKKIDSDLMSTGGYKDWCIQKLFIPSLTIEIGNPNLSHPLKDNDVVFDWEVNKALPAFLADLI